MLLEGEEQHSVKKHFESTSKKKNGIYVYGCVPVAWNEKEIMVEGTIVKETK